MVFFTSVSGLNLQPIRKINYGAPCAVLGAGIEMESAAEDGG